MAKLERVYNIPLRREYLNVPPHRRAKRCIAAIRKFLGRHLHSEDVRIGRFLNEYIWHRGMKFPPHHVKVEAVREDDGRVFAELVGAPKAEAVKEEKAKKEAKKEEKPEVKEEKKVEHKAEKKEEKPRAEAKKETKPKAEKKPSKKKE